MTKRIRSAVPIYLAALVWLVYGMLFPLYMLNHILTALSLSVAVYIATGYIFPGRTVTVEKKFSTGDKTLDAQLAEARTVLHKLHADNENIPDAVITQKLDKLEDLGGRILDRVAEQPGEASNVRKFMSYYLPTTEKLLSAYSRLQHAGITGGQVSETMKSVENSLDLIVTAFEKQLDSLYSAEYLDITTDIQVLETMMKNDGLMNAEGTPLN